MSLVELTSKFELLKARARAVKHRALPALGALLIIPGAAGAFGGGVAETHTMSGINLAVSYAAEAHINDVTHWQATVLGPLGAHGHFMLRLDKADFAHFKVANISPLPTQIQESRYGMTYTFDASQGRVVDFTMVPTSAGHTAATIQYGFDPPVAFSVTTIP